MTALAYRLHFAYLAAAIGVLALLPTVSTPAWVDRFAVSFALIGGLHAVAFVLALGASGAWFKRIAFVVLTCALSVAAPLLGMLAARLLSLPDSLGLIGAIAVASAAGATAYWWLVRRLWITQLPLRSAALTIVACTVVSPMSFFTAAALTGYGASKSLVADLLPTVAWWFTFSARMWLSEVSQMTANNSLERSRDR